MRVGKGEKESLYLGCIFEGRTHKTVPEGIRNEKGQE